MKANIFDIQTLDTQGENGARTTIYFNGCPLRCPWCSNPEAASRPTEIIWDRKKCFYGHLCEIHCPTDSIHFEGDILHFDHENCNGCRSCINQCPSKALEFAGKMVTLEEVMDVILKDQASYSNYAGVTLLGGEVFNQPVFATELLKKCREHSIHTLVETSGYASPLLFSRAAAYTDVIIFGIKHYDSKEHIKYTGVSPGKILENLDNAVLMKLSVTARIIVIPGFNNTLTDAKGFVKLLTEHRVNHVLLQFSPSPEGKKHDSLIEYADLFIKAGFNTQIQYE